MKKVIIIGGGAGGVILANSLDSKKFEIEVFDKNKFHFYQPWFLYLAFWGRKRNISRSIRSLLKSRVKLYEKAITKIDLLNKTIYSNSDKYSYDYLVIATGTVTDFSSIPGLAETNNEYGNYHTDVESALKVWQNLKNFNEGTIALGMSSPVIKCPPSPLEGILLTEEFISRRKLKDKTKLIFFTPFPRPYPAEPISQIVEPILKKRGIEVKTFFDVDKIDIQNKTIYSIEGESIKFDLPIIIPPCIGIKGIDFNPSSILTSDLFIKADKETMAIEGFKDAFVIGDAANIPTSKSGVTAHLQAKVLANILNGNPDKFNGRTHCPFDMGYGKGTFVIGDYNNPVVPYPPTRLKHFMKMMMANIYWLSLKGWLDVMFNVYFYITSPAKLNKKFHYEKPN